MTAARFGVASTAAVRSDDRPQILRFGSRLMTYRRPRVEDQSFSYSSSSSSPSSSSSSSVPGFSTVDSSPSPPLNRRLLVANSKQDSKKSAVDT